VTTIQADLAEARRLAPRAVQLTDGSPQAAELETENADLIRAAGLGLE
jgi:hypothetical protein